MDSFKIQGGKFMRWIYCLLALAQLLLNGSRAFSAEIVLARGGKSDYQIVLPKHFPTPSVGQGIEQTARLLQASFLASGVNIPIVSEEKKDPNMPGIWLGNTAFAKSQKIDLDALKGWGFVVRAVGRDLVIAGRDHAAPSMALAPGRIGWDRLGTAKGVVEFLQQYLGTRFLYPELPPNVPIAQASRVDFLASVAFEFAKKDNITIPNGLNLQVTPWIEFNTSYPARGSFYDLAHNRFPLVDTVFGGHTYERAAPLDVYGEKKPEYFALLDGRRSAGQPGNPQYCISNPEFVELLLKDLLRAVDLGYGCVDLGQPDGFRPCQCEPCRKLYGTGDDWSEKLWLLHRELAEKLKRERPGKVLTIMSYIQTANPPKSFRKFPENTRILLTGTNEDDFAPWKDYDVPQGYSSYVYNWCPNLGTRYTPMRTPLFVESQAKRLVSHKIQSIYRDGPGDLYGLEGPTYYTMGRILENPSKGNARDLVEEFCRAAFGQAAPSMLSFYANLYHGIELYANHLGTRDPAWSYRDIQGRRRKHLTDPMQLLGFLYTPSLLETLESDLTASEKGANTEKVRQRLGLVRREFEYLKALVRVVHLYHAYQVQPDMVSRERLLTAIDARNAFIGELFKGPRGGATPLSGFSFVTFPQLGHDAKHLKLAYDGYQEPFANSVMNWDTKVMRSAPLPGAKRMVAGLYSGPLGIADVAWSKFEAQVLRDSSGIPPTKNPTGEIVPSVKALSNKTHLLLRVEAPAPVNNSNDSIELFLAPGGGNDVVYRFTVGPGEDSRQDAANGFVTALLDPRFGKFDPDWNGDWKYETKIDPEKQIWTALFSVPFKTLGVDRPAAGSFWRGNIVHSRVVSGKAMRLLWSAQAGTRVTDDRNDFGEIFFEEGTSLPKENPKP